MKKEPHVDELMLIALLYLMNLPLTVEIVFLISSTFNIVSFDNEHL